MRRSLATVGFVVLTLLVAGGGAAQTVSGSADASAEAETTTDLERADEGYSTHNDYADVQTSQEADGSTRASAEASADAELDADRTRQQVQDRLDEARNELASRAEELRSRAESEARLADDVEAEQEIELEGEADHDDENRSDERRAEPEANESEDEPERQRVEANASSESYGRLDANRSNATDERPAPEDNRAQPQREDEHDEERDDEREPAVDQTTEIRVSHDHWVYAQQRTERIESTAQIRADGVDVEHERQIRQDADEGLTAGLQLSAAFSATTDRLQTSVSAVHDTTDRLTSEVHGIVGDSSTSARASAEHRVDERIGGGGRVTGEAGGKIESGLERDVDQPELPDPKPPRTEVDTETQASSHTEAETSLTGSQQLDRDV